MQSFGTEIKPAFKYMNDADLNSAEFYTLAMKTSLKLTHLTRAHNDHHLMTIECMLTIGV